jgi:hypothetical protein
MIRRLRSRLRRYRWRPHGIAAIGLLLALVASGCGRDTADQHAGHGATPPDNFETTAAASVLPSFLDNYTDTTKQLYAQAPQYTALLQELNCYCGCMEYNDPHDSLYRCFIAGTDESSITWTDHGGSCGVCLMELRDAVNMTEDGKTIDEIKQHIDRTYGGA